MKYYYKAYKSDKRIVGINIEIAVLDLDNDTMYERELHTGEYRKIKDLLEGIVKRLGFNTL